MNYFDAVSIYQDFCVSIQYADLEEKTPADVIKEKAANYTFNQIADCFEALLNDLDKKKEHYLSLYKIIAAVKKANGEKLEVEE